MRLTKCLSFGVALLLSGCAIGGDSACRGDNCEAGSETKVFDVNVNDHGNGQFSGTVTPAGQPSHSTNYSICQTWVGWCAIPRGPLGVACYCNAFPGYAGQVVQ